MKAAFLTAGGGVAVWSTAFQTSFYSNTLFGFGFKHFFKVLFSLCDL